MLSFFCFPSGTRPSERVASLPVGNIWGGTAEPCCGSEGRKQIINVQPQLLTFLNGLMCGLSERLRVLLFCFLLDIHLLQGILKIEPW